jgi:hypothetical protein
MEGASPLGVVDPARSDVFGPVKLEPAGQGLVNGGNNSNNINLSASATLSSLRALVNAPPQSCVATSTSSSISNSNNNQNASVSSLISQALAQTHQVPMQQQQEQQLAPQLNAASVPAPMGSPSGQPRLPQMDGSGFAQASPAQFPSLATASPSADELNGNGLTVDEMSTLNKLMQLSDAELLYELNRDDMDMDMYLDPAFPTPGFATDNGTGYGADMMTNSFM